MSKVSEYTCSFCGRESNERDDIIFLENDSKTSCICSICASMLADYAKNQSNENLNSDNQQTNMENVFMDKAKAFQIFEDWYNACIENGIEPEEIVAQMGGMALITNDELVDRLIDEGEIASY